MDAGNWIEIPRAGRAPLRGWLTGPRAGSGPGLVVLSASLGVDPCARTDARLLAEEGYVCLVPDLVPHRGDDAGVGEDSDAVMVDIAATLDSLRGQPACRGRIGVVGFARGGLLAALGAVRLPFACAVSWYGDDLARHAAEIARAPCPVLLQIAGDDERTTAHARATFDASVADNPAIRQAVHAGCRPGFADPASLAYDKTTRGLAWSRMIAELRRELGPHYDLSALWDAHTHHEFVTRDVDATMATMVDAPYVNHVPTMTGGVGHAHLKRFYKHHFVDANPPDTRLIPVSRTVGVDRLVDEMVFCFTHTSEIPWMLPGVPPTGRYVEVPLVAIVAFRGDRLCHEHIYWDQASVLVQIGLLDPRGLPVAGRATADKLRDESLPSNALMAAAWARSEGAAT